MICVFSTTQPTNFALLPTTVDKAGKMLDGAQH